MIASVVCLQAAHAALPAEASQLAESRLLAIKTAQLSGTASDVRFLVVSDPLVRGAMVWQETQRLYPERDSLTHVDEDALLQQQSRLQRLLLGREAPFWTLFDDTTQSLLYCKPDALSVCLLLDSDALASVLAVSVEDLIQAIGQNNASAPIWPSVLLLSALLAGLGWRWRHAHPGARVLSLQPPRNVEPVSARRDSRKPVAAEDNTFVMADMRVDVRRRKIQRDGLCVDISARDLRLLQYLHDHPDEVLSKDRLYDAGWGRTFVPGSRALEQHILTLRRKLDPERCLPNLIETVHGQGYRFPFSALND